jgi:sigma-B regulation protein RsbU (phosphoserine phosphatase)
MSVTPQDAASRGQTPAASLLARNAEWLYERAPFGYLLTMPDGLILRANATFLEMTGYEVSDLVDRRRFAELLTIGGRLYHETHFAPMLQLQGETHSIALELVGAKRQRIAVLVSSTVDFDADGKPVMVRSAIVNASERRAYERELLAAKQLAEAAEARASALSRTLQQTLIPPALPEIPGLDVAAVYRPAGETLGGDFYDVFQIGTDDWAVAIGDVSGKGPEAAVVTALVRHTLRAATVGHPQPSRALAMLNEVLRRSGATRQCTVALLRLRRAAGEWTATLSCAGHPLPLLLRAGALARIGRPGSMAAVFAEPRLFDTTIRLNPGDAILLYTDGITEGRQGEAFYGDERLEHSFVRHLGTASAMSEGVVADVLGFQGGVARDDIATVVIRFLVDSAQQ